MNNKVKANISGFFVKNSILILIILAILGIWTEDSKLGLIYQKLALTDITILIGSIIFFVHYDTKSDTKDEKK